VKRVLAVVLLLCSFVARAQNVDLENPGSVSAIQNRAYTMDFELDLGVGTLPLDAFYKGYYPTLAAVVHFSDAVAWQVARGGYSFNVSTGLRDQLERGFGVLPTAFDEVNWFIGSDLMLKPFYGKSAVLNTWVLHYEAFLLVGVSVFKFSIGGFSPAINLGGGIRLFQNRWVSYRLDVSDDLVINSKLKLSQVITIQLMLALNFGGTE
jgi:outer membrane beta-barrel protein